MNNLPKPAFLLDDRPASSVAALISQAASFSWQVDEKRPRGLSPGALPHGFVEHHARRHRHV
jgi:hypothetical protein